MMDNDNLPNPLDSETWSLLPGFFEELPNPVIIHLWGDPEGSVKEREAKGLIMAISRRFANINAAFFPRRLNFPYYPVIGVFGLDNNAAVDFGIRLIGLPEGVQLTSFIAAIQAASFRGVTLEAKTRIRLQSLDQDIRLELLTSADDEAGTIAAKIAFGLAVASPKIRSFLIMADAFPEAAILYSAKYLPHLVINGRVHADGITDEEEFLKQIAVALK